MNIAQIEGATRTIGEGQGYIGLPLRDVLVNCTVGGEGTPAMMSAWLPTPEELEALNAGKAIILTVLGTAHPPVMLEVEPYTPSKKCPKCGEIKPYSEFYPDKRKGLSSWCQQCKRQETNARRDPEKAKAYVEENREQIREYHAQRYIDNKEEINERVAAWRKANPDKVREIIRRHMQKRRSTPSGRLETNIQSGITRGLKLGGKNGISTFEALGFTLDELRAHLESLFQPGMTWENYGRHGWHVDHIRPLASFTYETVDDPEFKEAWALSNLQPLWWRDNISKGAKWVGPTAANDNAPPTKKDDKAA